VSGLSDHVVGIEFMFRQIGAVPFSPRLQGEGDAFKGLCRIVDDGNTQRNASSLQTLL
jgi:hypothetical protein